MEFATLLTPSSVCMSRTPFSKIPQWAQWSQRKWNIICTMVNPEFRNQQRDLFVCLLLAGRDYRWNHWLRHWRQFLLLPVCITARQALSEKVSILKGKDLLPMGVYHFLLLHILLQKWGKNHFHRVAILKVLLFLYECLALWVKFSEDDILKCFFLIFPG